MVVGETFAQIGYALAAKADEYQIPTIFPVIARTTSPSASLEVGGAAGWRPASPSHPFGEYAPTLGYKKVAVARQRLCLRLRGGGRIPEDLRGAGGQ